MVIVGRDTASLDGERQSAPVGDSCRKILLVERASCLPAHCTRRLDDEVPRVRGARDTRFPLERRLDREDRKSTRLNSSHVAISYAVFCLKKKKSQLSATTEKVVTDFR